MSNAYLQDLLVKSYQESKRSISLTVTQLYKSNLMTMTTMGSLVTGSENLSRSRPLLVIAFCSRSRSRRVKQKDLRENLTENEQRA